MAKVIKGQFTAAAQVSESIPCSKAAIHLTFSGTGDVAQDIALDDENFTELDSKTTTGPWEYDGVSVSFRLRCKGVQASETIDYVIRTA